MADDADRVLRRSLRLRDYDYSQPGAYFVTVCTWGRTCLFGTVADGQLRLNILGEIALACWADIPNHREGVELDAFIIMPNHIHAVFVIVDAALTPHGVSDEGEVHPGLSQGDTSVAPTADPDAQRRPTLGAIVGAFKAAVTRTARERGLSLPNHLWQRNYYEHVIRSDHVLEQIRKYIVENPTKWSLDRDNPATWQ